MLVWPIDHLTIGLNIIKFYNTRVYFRALISIQKSLYFIQPISLATNHKLAMQKRDDITLRIGPYSVEQKKFIVEQVVDNHFSPRDLSRKYRMSSHTIRDWVKKSGKTLPKTYKKSGTDKDRNGQENQSQGCAEDNTSVGEKWICGVCGHVFNFERHLMSHHYSNLCPGKKLSEPHKDNTDHDSKSNVNMTEHNGEAASNFNFVDCGPTIKEEIKEEVVECESDPLRLSHTVQSLDEPVTYEEFFP